MSFQAMAWAIKQKAPTKSKFLLLVLANYADERGVAWPSLATLSTDTGISRSVLIECLKKLCELDLMDKIKRYRGNLKTSNMYRLKMPD